MRIAAAIIAVLACWSTSVLAESAEMEVQRCIWRCLAEYGHSAAYRACVQQHCDDTPKKAERASRWTYGRHPVLGLSAHVSVGDEAFGLACIFAPDSPTTASSAAMRMTPGIAPRATEQLGAASLWLKPFRVGGAMTFQARQGYVEYVGGACDLGVPQMRAHKALLFLREKFVSLDTTEKNQLTMTVEKDGQPVVLSSEHDLYNLDEAMRVPLAGAGDAISKLAKACPALRRQMREGCSSGD